jgi:hypothetical protein
MAAARKIPPTIKFDPRDLIMGPYVLCSKCGVEQFGILSIYGTYYTRRCRNCWHKANFPLPEIRKRIVYIDQFAFSNIMKVLSPDAKGHERTASEPFWKELFETLGVVCHLQLVVCPDSKQHQFESLTSAFYESLKRTYEHFSGGLSFYASDNIKRKQIARLTECWLKKEPATFDFDAQQITHGKLHEWADRIYITVDGVLDGFIDGLRTTRNEIHKGLQEVFEIWQQERKSFKEVFEAEKAAYTRTLVQAYLAQQRKVNDALTHGQMPSLNDVLPSQQWMVLTQLQYTFEDAFGKAESIRVMTEFLRSDAMNDAPFNVIAASLFASLSQKAAAGQKRPPNQGTSNDVNVLSTLLPYCDAMFVDNECRALWQDIPRDCKLPYVCALFSPNIGDEFLRYLKEIRDSATSEHLKIVSEIYGPDPLKPPQSIYGVGKRQEGD